MNENYIRNPIKINTMMPFSFNTHKSLQLSNFFNARENLHFLKTIFSSFFLFIFCRVAANTRPCSHLHFGILYCEASEREPFSLHAYCLPKRKLHVVKLNLHEFILFVVVGRLLRGLALCYCLNIYTQSHFSLS